MLPFQNIRSTVAVLLMCVSALVADVSAQDLKRRGMIGVQLAPVTDEVKSRLKLEDAAGVLIGGVVPDGAAAAAGVLADDVVRKIGDASVSDMSSFSAAMRAFGAGDSVPFTMLRAGKEITINVVLRPRPGESHTDCELLYETAGDMGKRVRMLVTKPKAEGKRPAVMLLMGMSRQPSEVMFPGPHPVKAMIAELSKAGYVTARVDHPGVGDSEGSFDSTTVAAETAAMQSALAKLRTYDFVDPKNVFVLGHSMGTTIVPQVIKDQPVRGVITFAAVSRPWPETATEMLERQWKLELFSDDQLKLRRDAWKDFVDLFIGKKANPADIVKEKPQLRELLGDSLEGGTVLGMPAAYAQELAVAPPATKWSDVKVPVLAIWGEADFAASRKDSEMIAETVNKGSPGKATFLAHPKIDHNLGAAADQEESFLSGMSPFQPKFVETITKWMAEQSNKG